jgi:hypothetical protein
MTTPPSRQSPGGSIVLRIDRCSGGGPSTAEYSMSFGATTAMGGVLLGRFHGLADVQTVLRKLSLSGPAVAAASSALTERSFHEIAGVHLTPSLIRELGL